MSTPIDSIRGSANVRQHRRPSAERTERTVSAGLPVPVEPPRPLGGGSFRASGDAAIQAQVIGERRGLRAGPTIHDEARASYTRIEWSGTSDRRRPKGVVAKTKI